MNKKSLVITLDLLLVAILLFGRWITNQMIDLLPTCYATSLGIQCPACGGTRCFRYIVSGNITNAFLVNPYVFLSFMLLGVLVILLNCAVLFGKGEQLLCKLARPGLVIVWAVCFLLFGILRNLF